jgi:pSer/pThr/pTyr-binding forkhead associated (FHA) protein
MIQFKILSGKKAGTLWAARHFPIRIGRSPASDLQLEESGVWDHHLQISLAPSEGFVLEAQPNALVTVNGQSAQHTPLRNGDTIEIGLLKIQFWLSEARQRNLRARESFVWVAIGAVTAGEIGLIYWLLQIASR